ncbi:unnamed protein product [Acanthosepion pharaonis]|uniref:Uncharacterized protein n=1 Tax=Acanthosepion pharaonis TaxID=158019 RepID=A0A812CA22_ACAPH|nr:unnamed protein product [Sepia pharaonis]
MFFFLLFSSLFAVFFPLSCVFSHLSSIHSINSPHFCFVALLLLYLFHLLPLSPLFFFSPSPLYCLHLSLSPLLLFSPFLHRFLIFSFRCPVSFSYLRFRVESLSLSLTPILSSRPLLTLPLSFPAFLFLPCFLLFFFITTLLCIFPLIQSPVFFSFLRLLLTFVLLTFCLPFTFSFFTLSSVPPSFSIFFHSYHSLFPFTPFSSP